MKYLTLRSFIILFIIIAISFLVIIGKKDQIRIVSEYDLLNCSGGCTGGVCSDYAFSCGTCIKLSVNRCAGASGYCNNTVYYVSCVCDEAYSYTLGCK